MPPLRISKGNLADHWLQTVAIPRQAICSFSAAQKSGVGVLLGKRERRGLPGGLIPVGGRGQEPSAPICRSARRVSFLPSRPIKLSRVIEPGFCVEKVMQVANTPASTFHRGAGSAFDCAARSCAVITVHGVTQSERRNHHPSRMIH